MSEETERVGKKVYAFSLNLEPWAIAGRSGNTAGLTYKGNTAGVIPADSQLLDGLAAYA